MANPPPPRAWRDGQYTELRAAALLLDLDGTLVDSTALITRAWTRWAVEEGLNRESFTGVPLHGRPARDIVHDLLPDREEEALRRIVDIEASTPGGVRTLPGADRLLNHLRPEEWAVVTSGSGRIAEPRLAALAVRPRVVVTADDVQRGKPDPEPFLLAAHRRVGPLSRESGAMRGRRVLPSRESGEGRVYGGGPWTSRPGEVGRPGRVG